MPIIDYDSVPRRRSRLKTLAAWLSSVTLIGIAFIQVLGWWAQKQEADFQNSRWQYYQAHPEARTIVTPTTAVTPTAATSR